MMRRVVIGTRGSLLARLQAECVKKKLESACSDIDVSLRIIATAGDLDRTHPLEAIGGKGVFVKALEQALLDGELDCCVHSMKDVPPELAPGLVIGAVPEREDVRDVLITRARTDLRGLPRGARIGTGSSRRRAQLSQIRADIEFAEMRGNLDTRLSKLERGDVDALVVAAAGMHRLNREHRIDAYLPVHLLVPAAGQGALGIEVRADDDGMLELCQQIDDANFHRDVTLERELMRAVDGDCSMPFGAYGRIERFEDKTIYRLDACLLYAGRLRRVQMTGDLDDAHVLVERAAKQLTDDSQGQSIVRGAW